MNHRTPPQTNPPYTNGHYEAPLELSGVSLRRPAPVQKPTVFPTELPLRGLGPILYALQRFQLGGMPFTRYLASAWVIIALLAGVGILPGRWITVTLAVLLLIAQVTLVIRQRRQHYITFTSAPTPVLNDVPLATSEKLPIYATGLLGVEGRYQRYSALPGFYRTFATGEHAVLCRVTERTWLGVLNWPQEEVGMWYAFIKPTDIQRLAWGNLHFGPTVYPALAVEYQLELPPGPRRKQTEFRQETIYVATPALQDAQRLYIDLLNNLPDDKVVNALSAPS